MIIFNEENHKYFNEEGKELISVTTLLSKHNLAPDYSGVDRETLTKKALRGTLIHEELDKYIKTKEIGFTKEVQSFIDYLDKHNDIKIIDNEFVVNNDIVAGRADLLLEKDNKLIIADFKTTSQIHHTSVSWQLSIYAMLTNKDIELGQVFWFDKFGNLEVIDIKLQPKEEVEKLFECERNGILYQEPKNNLILSDNLIETLSDVEMQIRYFENMKKQAEEKAQVMRQAIMLAMENNGLKSFENDNLKITYVAPSTRKSLDSTRLKLELPDIYEQYLKINNTKASLRITFKEN